MHQYRDSPAFAAGSSGFPAATDSRIVLQVRLRCTQGSVRWIYPGQGLRVVLQPSLSSGRRSAVCIKAWPSLRGASVYVERSGELELLVADGGRSEDQVFCFGPDGPRWPTVYLQTSPQTDGAWSRRGMGFRYELLGNRSAALHLDMHGGLKHTHHTATDVRRDRRITPKVDVVHVAIYLK